jgi:hypothetical protein
MLASVLISAVSLVLLGYWFRYSCLLLLRARAAQSPPSQGHRFSFLDVRARLHTEPNLDPLHRSLERDYRVVTYLLQHASTLGAQSLEDRLLMLDYRVMQGWYCVTRTVAPAQARRALAEMAEVLGCLAQKMGAQAGLQTQI